MKTIATFSKPEEAHLLRTRLEAGGIAAFVQDENMVQMNWLYSDAIGGVRVQIAEEDVPRAMEWLGEQKPVPEDGVVVRCPFCHSGETEADEWPRRLSFLSLLFLQFPLWCSRHRYRCKDCGKAWNERKRSSFS